MPKLKGSILGLAKWFILPAALFFVFRLGLSAGEQGTTLLETLKGFPDFLRMEGSAGHEDGGSNGDAYSEDAPLSDLKYHSVLAAEYDDRNEAKVFRGELSSNRINSFILKSDDRFYVLVGRYSSAGKARKTLKSMHDKGYENAQIVGSQE